MLTKQFPGVKILWGGALISQSFEVLRIFLQHTIVHGLVIGEGELPLLEICQGKPLDQVKGVMTYEESDDPQFHYTPGEQLDLDDLPTPDYRGIHLLDYAGVLSVYTSRGCTHRCTFCAEYMLSGPRFRTRSVEKVVADIEKIIKACKPYYIIFGDSLINHSSDAL